MGLQNHSEFLRFSIVKNDVCDVAQLAANSVKERRGRSCGGESFLRLSKFS
jgi:hypothetical protein